MNTIVLQDDVRIPCSVVDLDSFRQWAKSDAFPQSGRYSFFDGELWVDLMPEQLFTHISVKLEYTHVLHAILKATRRGRFFGDRTLVTNVEAGLSTEPDGTIVLFESLENGAVELVEGAGEGYLEITGTPDAVLEIVSATSVRKDNIVLRKLYWLAGVAEYWLVDVRSGRLQFDILKRGRNGYAASRKKSGWLSSSVLERSVRLTSQPDAAGNPEFTLEVA